MTLLARSTTAASSSFLRWFRSSWNSRRLRWNSRSCSTRSRWRRLRSASARVGASLSSLSAAAFRRLADVGQLLLALAELGLELGLRGLRRGRVAQHALAVDVADLQFLRLRRRRRPAPAAAAATSGLHCGCFSSERGPDLELKPLDSIFGLLADRRAVAQLQRARPARSSSGRRRPMRAGCRR